MKGTSPGAETWPLISVAVAGLLAAACAAGTPAIDESQVRQSGSSTAYQYRRPPQLHDGWAVASAKELGLTREPLERMTEAIRRGSYRNVHAVLIAKDGRLVYEEYFAGVDKRDRTWPVGRNVTVPFVFHRDSLHDIRSAGKSVAATLVGIALGSGAIRSLDEPLFDYFPEHAGLATPEKRRITLRHALTMTTGLEWNEGGVSPEDSTHDEKRMARSHDPAGFVLGRPLAAEPGSKWQYNAGASTLLGYVISRATGESLGAFARTRLFEPLGITTVEWGGPMGWRDIPELHWPSSEPWASVATPTGELWMQARDLLKFAQLYLNGGRWNGNQVVPETWTREALKPQVAQGSSEYGEGVSSRNGYGYHWWFRDFRLPYGELEVSVAYGNGGQRAWVVPQLRLAVVHLAGNYNVLYQGWEANRLLLERIVPWAMGVDTQYRHEHEKTVRALAPGEWPAVQLSPLQRAAYVGIYEERARNAVWADTTRVWERDGVLRMAMPGGGAIDLVPEGDHVFAAGRMEKGQPTKIYWPGERVVFVLKADQVIRYEWRYAGGEEANSTAVRLR